MKYILAILLICLIIVIVIFTLHVFEDNYQPQYTNDIKTLLLDNGFKPINVESITYYENSRNSFEQMLKDINNENRYVNVSMFSIYDGVETDRYVDTVIAAIKRGAYVRCIIDTLGMHSEKSIRKMKNNGVDVVIYNPISKYKYYLSMRNHDKYTMIGDNILYIYSYILDTDSINNWIEFGIRIKGNFQNMNMDEEITKSLLRESFDSHHIYIPFWCDRKHSYGLYTDIYLNTIINTKKELYIINPYFAPPNVIIDAIIEVSYRAKIKMFVISEKSDYPIITEETKRIVHKILSEGNNDNILCYKISTRFIHAKIMLSDNENIVLGSANLDYRSLFHMHENGIYIKDEEMYNQIKTQYDKISEECELETSKYTVADKLFYNVIGNNSIFKNLL